MSNGLFRVAVTGLLGLVCAVTLAAEEASPVKEIRAVPGDGYSFSTDGRYFAFASTLGLVPRDYNRRADMYVLDLLTGEISLVSLNLDGALFSAGSGTGSICGDGATVTYDHAGTGEWQAYANDWQEGTVTMVSVSSTGEPANRGSRQPYPMSADGRIIAFTSLSDNLVEGDTNYQATNPITYEMDGYDVFVHDRDTGVTTRVSVSSSGEQSDGDSENPALSADGRLVVFLSWASNLAPIPFNNTWRVYLHDRQTGITRPISLSTEGEPNNKHCYEPSISPDGRYVVFTSLADNLVPGDTNCTDEMSASTDGNDVFVHDLETGITSRVSVSSTGAQANLSSHSGRISGNGRFVVFSSGATNLTPEGVRGIFRHDRYTGQTILVSRRPDGYIANQAQNPVISHDGSHVAFRTSDTEFPQGNYIVTLAAEPVAWPLGSTLEALVIGRSVLTLSWTAAVSDGAVSGYRIYRNGAFQADVSGDTTVLHVSGLTPDTEYVFKVETLDGPGGGESTDGPALTVRMRDGNSAAALTAITPPGGLADLLWDPALPGSGAVGYRIYRMLDGQPAILVKSIQGLDTTHYRDTGLAAGTSYTYSIYTVDAAGGEQPHTMPLALLTPPLQAVTALAWQVPRAAARLALLGAEVSIRLAGEPNRMAEAEVGYLSWFDEYGAILPEPRPARARVALAETPGAPGLYRGSFVIVNGIARLDSLAAELHDGAGHAVQATAGIPGPVAVSGGLRVQVLEPGGGLPPAKLKAWSETANNGAQEPVTAAGEFLLSGLLPSADYSLTLTRGDGRQLAGLTGLAVTGGLFTAASLTPKAAAWLRLLLVDETGTPIPGAGVTFNDTATGEYLEFAQSGWNGWLEALHAHLSGDVVRATARAGLPYAATTVETLTLAEGETPITLTVTRLPEGTLSGRVREPAGAGMEGVLVTAVQTLAGRSWTRRAITGPDGLYSLGLMAGAADVEAASPAPSHAPAKAGVSVPAGGQLVQDFTLAETGPGTVSVAINTNFLGEGWQPLPMDLATARRYKLAVHGVEVAEFTYPLQIRGKAGDLVEVTVDGTEFNLPKATRQVMLDANRSATAFFDLEEQGARIHGRVLYKSGQGATGWRPELYKDDGFGRWQSVMRGIQYLGADGTALTERLEVGLAGAGHYQIRIDPPYPWPSLYLASGYQVPTSIIDLELEGDEVIELGDVFLDVDPAEGSGTITGPTTRLTWSAPDPLEPSIIALRSHAVPGAQVTFRVVYYNHGGIDLNAVALLLDIPAGTSLVPGSIILNNQPAIGSVSGSTLEVPAGGIPANGSGMLYYQLRLDSGLGAQTLGVGASMRYRTGGSVFDLTQSIGRAEVEVLGLTIEAPRLVTGLAVTLTGRAPSGGDPVRVYDGPVLLGEAPVSAGGYWRLEASLPDTGSPVWHTLRAQSWNPNYSTTLHSAKLNVRYDPDQPVLRRMVITMLDTEGRQSGSVAIDTADGVARFPFRVVPGYTLRFELQFTLPDRLAEVKVRLAGSGGATAGAARGADGIFRAELVLGHGSLGPISYSYRNKLTPAAYQNMPLTEEQLRDKWPWPASALTIVETDPFTGPDDSTASASVTIADKQLQAGLTIQRAAAYSPTAAEEAEVQLSGIPLYGFAHSWTLVDGTLWMEASGYIPESLLEAQQGRAGPSSVGAFALVILRAGVSPVSVADSSLSILNVLGVPDTFFWIQQLLDQIDRDCVDCGCDNDLRATLEEIARDVMIGHALKAGMDLAAVLTLPSTAGLGTGAVILIKFAIGARYDAWIEGRLDALQQQIDDRCALPDPNPDTRLTSPTVVADPAWLIDPSGYVYEALPQVRLEGVTATLLMKDPASGEWTPWDAAWFGQTNPLITDAGGHYAWDVPQGTWKVAYAQEGYAPAYSAELPVPPPHLDVNIGMRALASPEVSGITMAPGGRAIDITFTSYMLVDAVDPARVSLVPLAGDGTPLDTVLVPLQAAADPDGRLLARAFRLTSAAGFSIGSEFLLKVDALMENYAGRTLDDAYATTFVLAPVLEINPSSGFHPPEASAGHTIGITANGPWTAAARDDWLSITSGSSAQGDATLTYSVAANTGRARVSSIEFAGTGISRVYTVTQAVAFSPHGIPADWLLDHALAADGSQDLLDPDGDGLCVLAEWIGGTDPVDRHSSFVPVMQLPSAEAVSLRWPVAAGRRYFLYACTNLAQPDWVLVHGPVDAQSDGFIEYGAAMGAGPVFYQLMVQWP